MSYPYQLPDFSDEAISPDVILKDPEATAFLEILSMLSKYVGECYEE